MNVFLLMGWAVGATPDRHVGLAIPRTRAHPLVGSVRPATNKGGVNSHIKINKASFCKAEEMALAQIYYEKASDLHNKTHNAVESTG